ncbi:helix-turn-helix domain-containing protein [Streptomyces indicus]|uniref:Helix-turn-helix n=1 Tax=Streptomyces indicus TaxID=417292 RepID=A0A1G9C8T4_9ACTN|nr:helix-turn-helix transcriptional regulator [Streptomyces indicus]SDK48080.1 Helix-turn-helix [Streptomyces indicus]
MSRDALEEFAAWMEDLMRSRGYDIDNPRGGGRTRIADDAGVHRAAVTRLLQRQSMPDLTTMRGLARALGVPVRDVLIRSGRLTEEDLPASTSYNCSSAAEGRTITLEEAAELLGVPEERRDLFLQVAAPFLPSYEKEARRRTERR